MADGIYYVDTKAPFETAALPTVTLLSTFLPLWPVTTWTPTAQGYWWPGKEVRMRAFGTLTTAATPGNLTVSINFGTAAATGALATSAAMALVASQTTIPWTMDAYIVCRGVGASGSGGSMFAWGRFNAGVAVITAANVGAGLVPASAPAAVNVDTTVASGVNIQMSRSGSTAETATVQDLIFQALN